MGNDAHASVRQRGSKTYRQGRERTNTGSRCGIWHVPSLYLAGIILKTAVLLVFTQINLL